jgi:crossover junction endodeoxyribonuclease RuvC
MNIVALDLSLTATGFACSDGRSGVLEPKKLSGMERLAWILDRIVDLTIDADVIVIEAYQGFSYASKGTTSQDLAGLGTLVRFTLFELHRATVDIAPASLKKFATGKGNAKKPDMLMAAVKQLDWNGSTNDNVIDAVWLLEMARAHYTGTAKNQAQREAIGKVQWPVLSQALEAAS